MQNDFNQTGATTAEHQMADAKINCDEEAALTVTKNKELDYAVKLSEEVAMDNLGPKPDQLTHESKDQDFPALCDVEIDGVGCDF